MRPPPRLATLVLLAALSVTLWPASNAAAASNCPGAPIHPKVLYSTGDTLEYGIFDSQGRFFYSDDSTSYLMRIDHLGDTPARLAAVAAPGAIVFAPNGLIIMGTGDSLQNGAMGDATPMSGLVRVDPTTGATQPYATGLGMANGVAMGPDGAIYATNDLGYDVDRVKDGQVAHPWARVYSTNGIVVSPDNRYVYVSQTFQPAAIQRISVADPSQVTPYAVADSADMAAGLDDMTMDGQGNLYVAANGAGQVWKVDTRRAICVIATGLSQPSAVNFGVGPNARNLYVVGFDGHIDELPNVLPALGAGPPGAKAPSRHRHHRRRRAHQRHHRRPARSRRRHVSGCADPDRDRDCD